MFNQIRLNLEFFFSNHAGELHVLNIEGEKGRLNEPKFTEVLETSSSGQEGRPKKRPSDLAN